MKDTLSNLLSKVNIEFVEIQDEIVLNACVNQHMVSVNGDCEPQP